MAVSKVDAANQIENQLPQANIANNTRFRNIIINGDMSIAQRGTSATGLGNGDGGYYTCDRWRFGEVGAPTFEFTMSQETDVPSGQGFSKSLKYDCTTAQASLGADNALYLIQRFEGQNLQYLKKGTANATSLTLSFWVKSNKTGTYISQLYDNDNNRSISKSYTIDSSNTWEKKTITFAGDTSGTLDNDNANSLEVYFSLGLGTDRTSGTLQTSWGTFVASDWGAGQTVNLADSTDNEWYITGVQLEAGTTASDFEFLPYDINLQRCKRYYVSYIQDTSNAYFAPCTLFNSNRVRGTVYLEVEMRADPTVTIDGTLTVVGKDAFSGGGGDASSVTISGKKRALNIGGETTNNYTNSFMYLYISGDEIKVDAEL